MSILPIELNIILLSSLIFISGLIAGLGIARVVVCRVLGEEEDPCQH